MRLFNGYGYERFIGMLPWSKAEVSRCCAGNLARAFIFMAAVRPLAYATALLARSHSRGFPLTPGFGGRRPQDNVQYSGPLDLELTSQHREV